MRIKTTDIVSRVTTATSSSSYTCDWGSADVIDLTLTGNVTLAMGGAVNGQRCLLRLRQDATGGRTITLPSSVRFGAEITSVTLSGASKVDYVGLIYDGSANRYDVIAVSKGY